MCAALDAINDRLAVNNHRIAVGFQVVKKTLKLSPPMIMVEKIDPKKRGRGVTVLASFCPFCGGKHWET